MNIQQLRYVVAIANSGTFREAAEKMYVSQPSLSISVRDLEKELGFKIFRRTSSGTFLTRRGMEFYEKAQELVKGFDIFQNQYANPEEEKDEFSIASQHYDFLPPTITAFSKRYPDYKNFRIFESTTVQILDEVAQGHSEIGIIYLNNQNKKGIMQRVEKLGLEVIELLPFHTHIYLREGHPLAKKDELVMEDLVDLPTVRFTQEKDEYLYYSENFVDTSSSSQMFNVTDRATLNGILERTDAYATGSGFLDSDSVNGITVIRLKDNLDNHMVFVKREEVELSQAGTLLLRSCKNILIKRGNHEKRGIVAVLILLLIALDQLVKSYIVQQIPLGEVRTWIPKLVSLTYLQNRGAAFSMLQDQQWFFAIITLVVMVGAIWYLHKHMEDSIWMVIGLTLIIAGGLGNFIDRLSQGFVVDMFHLDFINFAIFNVADSYLTVGVIILLIAMLKEEMNGN